MPGESYGQRSLAAAVHGVAELDTTERLTHTHTHRESIVMAIESSGQWLSAMVSDLAGLVWGQQ